MSAGTRFAKGDRVEAVEHVDSTRQPRPDGDILPGIVIAASESYARVRFGDGRAATFWQGSGWEARTAWFRWRLRLAVPETAPARQEAPDGR